MPTCDTCGNDYDKAFTVTTVTGDQYTFDSIECAAQKLAPNCTHCGVRILGHGLEATSGGATSGGATGGGAPNGGDAGRFYCCDHCAQKDGVTGLNDRVSS